MVVFLLQKAKSPGAVALPRTRCSTRNARLIPTATKSRRCASAPTFCVTCQRRWRRLAAYSCLSLVPVSVFLTKATAKALQHAHMITGQLTLTSVITSLPWPIPRRRQTTVASSVMIRPPRAVSICFSRGL